MPPRAPDYSRKLARVIVLKDGKRLVTLQDAADVILDVFGSVNGRGGHVDSTVERLIAAAQSRKRSERHCITKFLALRVPGRCASSVAKRSPADHGDLLTFQCGCGQIIATVTNQ